MIQNATGRGIFLMSFTTFLFAIQDTLSRLLASEYNAYMVVMIRFWIFAAFVTLWSARRKGGLRKAIRSKRPALQLFRGALLGVEILTMTTAFVLMGLINTHALFAIYPLLVTALSGPLLGEKIGWRRWASVGVGFVGVLIILKPGTGIFSIYALLPIASAFMFALYGLLNRFVARDDEADVSFFYTAIGGLIFSTLVGIWHWESVDMMGWVWLNLLSFVGISGHFCLIKAYEAAEASAIQPFAYLQLPFVSVFGVLVFQDLILPNVALGAAIVVCAGVFALLRSRRASAR